MIVHLPASWRRERWPLYDFPTSKAPAFKSARMPNMNFLSLIEAKRDGQTLDLAQIKELIGEYTAGKILDYQMAAFLMAVYFRGLTREETRALMLAMRDSANVFNFFPRTRAPPARHTY